MYTHYIITYFYDRKTFDFRVCKFGMFMHAACWGVSGTIDSGMLKVCMFTLDHLLL